MNIDNLFSDEHSSKQLEDKTQSVDNIVTDFTVSETDITDVINIIK